LWQSHSMIHRKLLAALVLSFVFAAPLHAQDSPCLHRTVIASVYNRRDEPIAGLDSTAFAARLHGKPVKILSVSTDPGPRRILVLIDVSQTMFPNALRESELEAARDFVSRQPFENPVALLLFADGIKERFTFAQGREPILRRIEFLRADPKVARRFSGHAAVWDTLGQALETLGPFRRGDVFFLYSYCLDDISRGDPRKIADALLYAGIRLFIITPPDAPIPQFELFDPIVLRARTEELLTLARDTGGAFVVAGIASETPSGMKIFPVQANEERQMLNFLQSIINMPYKLQLELPEEIHKPQEWDLEPVRTPAAKEGRWRVSYQRRLLPCPAK
jgi:von Willebrand factor type A domain